MNSRKILSSILVALGVFKLVFVALFKIVALVANELISTLFNSISGKK
jgi:hypothetical protein